MELKLQMSQDGMSGFISTIDCDGNSLVCKEVGVDEYDQFLGSLADNPNYFFQERKNEFGVHYVRDRFTDKLNNHD